MPLASSPTDALHRVPAADGTMLAWREIGAGRPLMLIHGLFSNAVTNWIRYGHAERLAGAGLRLILPDLRGHGESDKPHDPARYPPDILADDGLALVAHLGLEDYDLGGYSLGGRTVVRMGVKGATPARAIVAGKGLDGLSAHERTRMGLARSFQLPRPFRSMSVADNLRVPLLYTVGFRTGKHLPSGEIRARCDELLRLVGLSDQAAHRPRAAARPGGCRSRGG